MLVITQILMTIVLAYAVARPWQVREFFAYLRPGLTLASQFVLALDLNPRLMPFSFWNGRAKHVS